MAAALAALRNNDRSSRKRPLTINHADYTAANPVYVGDESSSVEIAALNVELRCPICLRLMRDPMATECLHRFCKECIEKCQRTSQKHCPSCRKPIATRRSLRPDPNIALLIKKLYPDLEAFEAEEEEQIAESNRDIAEKHLANIVGLFEKQRAMHAQRADEAPNVEYETVRSSSNFTAAGRSGEAAASGHGDGLDDEAEEADDDVDDEDENDGLVDDDDDDDVRAKSLAPPIVGYVHMWPHAARLLAPHPPSPPRARRVSAAPLLVPASGRR